MFISFFLLQSSNCQRVCFWDDKVHSVAHFVFIKTSYEITHKPANRQTNTTTNYCYTLSFRKRDTFTLFLLAVGVLYYTSNFQQEDFNCQQLSWLNLNLRCQQETKCNSAPAIFTTVDPSRTWTKVLFTQTETHAHRHIHTLTAYAVDAKRGDEKKTV